MPSFVWWARNASSLWQFAVPAFSPLRAAEELLAPDWSISYSPASCLFSPFRINPIWKFRHVSCYTSETASQAHSTRGIYVEELCRSDQVPLLSLRKSPDHSDSFSHPDRSLSPARRGAPSLRFMAAMAAVRSSLRLRWPEFYVASAPSRGAAVWDRRQRRPHRTGRPRAHNQVIH